LVGGRILDVFMEIYAITVIATLAGADRQLPQKAPRRSAISAEGRRSEDHRRTGRR
jgi:hypothetical protein